MGISTSIRRALALARQTSLAALCALFATIHVGAESLPDKPIWSAPSSLVWVANYQSSIRTFGAHTVQVGAFPDAASATRKATEIEKLGFSPVLVQPSEDFHRVFVGFFPYYVEANLIRDELRALDCCTGAFIAAHPDPEIGMEQYQPLSAFASHRTSSGTSAEWQEFANRSDYQALRSVVRDGDRAQAASVLSGKLSVTPADDPIVSYANLNLGIDHVREGNYESARNYFKAVVEQGDKALPVHRTMALRRLAWTTHQLGDRLEAYRLYKQMGEEAETELVYARAIAEKLGLMMELAESGRGTHDEVRHAYTQWAPLIPADQLRYRAVADLIFMETYFRQPNANHRHFAGVVALGREFMYYYRPEKEAVMREYAAAMFQTAMVHAMVGQHEASREMYERIFEEIPVDAPQFAGFNPHSQGMIGLANYARRTGDTELANQIRRDIVELFPNEDITRQILQNSPDIRTELLPSFSGQD